ncbi:RcpC/CpaB family pilus assembly protein [Actinomadura kijaniata]|uniref:RcpC/CpaB family pilus assembly protein n=1 Tax=Actinomadura kijaniata TaxID=46161 RepID=UPI003F1D7359
MIRRRGRRSAAVLLAALGTGLALVALRPVATAGVPLTVAARDLPGGATVTASDVRTVRVPSGSVPAGTVAAPVTRTLAGPMRRGEAFTDVRFLGPDLLDGYGPGTVAAPVRIADAEAARLLRPGDRVHVLDAPKPDAVSEARPSAPTRLVASSAPVIMVPRAADNASGQGALVVLAVDRTQAAALAGASGTLSIALAGR